MYYNNGGTTNIAQTSDPDNAAEFYNYMRNLWKNGNPLVVETPSGPFNPGNGDGFTNDGSGQRTLYAYPQAALSILRGSLRLWHPPIGMRAPTIRRTSAVCTQQVLSHWHLEL